MGFLLVFLSLLVWWISHRKKVFSIKQGALWATAMIILSLGWYGVDLITNGFWFITEFLNYQVRLLTTEDAGHGGPVFYHTLVLLIGCFPASIFAARALFRGDQGDALRKWMRILFWVVLILFSLVQSKIVHYSSMCYFPLTFLAADELYRLGERKGARWMAWMVGIIGFSLGIAFTALPIVGMDPDVIIPYIKDPFAVANFEASVSWSVWEVMIDVLYHKSYAHLFYFQKPGPTNDKKELLQRSDKPIWIVMRMDRLDDEYKAYGLIEQHRKNGFVFLYKEPTR